MVIGKAEGSAISLDDAIDQFLVGCRIFGKTTQDGTPTPDAPVELMSVGVDGSVGIEVCGKNLLNIKSGTVDGFTIINNGSKIVINGTNPNSYAMRLKLCDVKVVAGMRYCLSGGLSSDNTLVASKAIDTFEIQSEGAAGVYTATETAMFGVYIRVDAGQTLSNYAICPQLEIGSAATGYEAYKGQTLTISTPNGLPGIPVSSGGNYTDATGQQWICDEIDFARGVYVKRLVRKIFDGSEYWRLAERDKSIEKVGIFYVSMDGTIAGFPALCNRYSKAEKNASSPSALGKFDTLYSQFRVNAIDYETTLDEWVALLGDWYEQGNPLEGVFALATPITTDLPKEDLAAYDAIHTYRENTTVYNDASAYMELEYVMDAKKYIDSMISGTILQARVE